MLTKIANMWTTPFTRPFVIILSAEVNDIILFYLFIFLHKGYGTYISGYNYKNNSLYS